MVAIFLIAMLQVLLWLPGDQERPREPEVIEGGRIVIRGEVTWEGREGLMDLPVVVERNGDLTIRGCDLRVRLEELVLGDVDWFSVEDGGRLAVEDSTISIVADPDLEKIMYFMEPSWRGSNEGYFRTYTCRAVNLHEATDPALELDMDGRGMEGQLVVAVQADPPQPLDVLAVIDVMGDESRGWVHHRVPLTDHAGSIVMLALLPRAPDAFRPMLKNVRVTDGGSDLPGDSFPTGKPVEDDWYCSGGLNDLRYAMKSQGFNSLFGVSGELTLEGSNLTAPSVPRSYRDIPNRDIKMTLDGYGSGWNVNSLALGGDVSLWLGSVAINACTLDNVTLWAVASEVSVADTVMVADRELVTLFMCSGSFSRTVMRSAYGLYTAEYAGWFTEKPLLWAMSVWDMRGADPLSIEDCTFQDCKMGLDLAKANVRVEGCAFVNCSRVGIWDHASFGLGSWNQLAASNSFEDCNGAWLFQSHDLFVELSGPGKPTDPGEWWHTEGELQATDGGWLSGYDMIWTNRSGASVYMPALLVNRTGVALPCTWLDLKLWTDWGGGVVLRVPAEATRAVAVFTGDNMTWNWEGNSAPPEFDVYSVLPKEAPGLVELNVSVNPSPGMGDRTTSAYEDFHLRVLLDDEPQRDIDVEEERWSEDVSLLRFPFELEVPPGLHDVKLVLTGIRKGGDEREELYWENLTMGRADATTPAEEIVGWTATTYPYILLDPGTHVSIDELPDPDEAWPSYILPLSWEGSSFTLRNVTEGDETLGIWWHGPGELVLEDLDLASLHIGSTMGRIRARNVTGIDLGWTEMHESHVDIEDSLVHLGSWSIFSGTNLSFRDCRLDCTWGGYFIGEAANASISDCLLEGNGTELSMLYDGISITGCTFEDLNLTIWPSSARNRWRLEGSRFEGPNGFLKLVFDGDGGDHPPVDIEVANNSFLGPSTGIQAPDWLVEELLSGNELAGGAVVHVQYWTRLDIQAVDPEYYHYVWVLPGGDTPVIQSGRTWYDDQNMTVTLELEDASQVQGPHLVRVVVLRGGDNGMVVWFDEVDVTQPVVTVPAPSWAATEHDMRDLLASMEVDGGWWTGP